MLTLIQSKLMNLLKLLQFTKFLKLLNFGKCLKLQLLLTHLLNLFSKSLPIVITNGNNPKPIQNINSSKSQIFVQNL